MKKRFNTTGTCIPEKHYMADTSEKIRKIKLLVEQGLYFTINRPRQYGKTTTMYLLKKELEKEFTVVSTSFEGISSDRYETHEKFLSSLFAKLEDASDLFENHPPATTFDELSRYITQINRDNDKKIVLIIDEVDKSLNNQLFLDFLAMLRNKYLKQNEDEDTTFHSIVLGGVHDVKSMKAKLRPNEEQKYNSPWNIAVDFDIDLSLNQTEIKSMLDDFAKCENIQMDSIALSKKLWYYTSGYPFLVSKLCELMYKKEMNIWNKDLLEEALKNILAIDNTNFQSLIKNLEDNEQLYKVVYEILLEGKGKSFNLQNPLINKGVMYGIFDNDNGKLAIHNRLYSQLIYDYMSSKIETSMSIDYNFRDNFILDDGTLDFKKVLLKFQQFMKEQYSTKERDFVEKHGRLIFLAFIKPIINGQGFDFKEVQISEEKRLDIVITYLNQKYIVELKMWYGEEAHQKGLRQLHDYLEKESVNEGFLVIFSKNKKKEWKNDATIIDNKNIFMVWA